MTPHSKHSQQPSVLFILKRRQQCDGQEYSHSRSSGLANSVRLVVDQLMREHHAAVFEVVTDNNDIDRMVTRHRPSHVVIEALWVVPEKFDVLKRLHPNVEWIVRLHSELPFLALEGVAFEWLHGYVERGVTIACNSQQMAHDLTRVLPLGRFVYLPNYYHMERLQSPMRKGEGSFVNVACMGAIRPLKNTLIQATAAIEFARQRKQHLRFHVNASRVEQRGDNVLKNLRGLFARTPDAQLIEWNWHEHDFFKTLLARHIDLGMQVSFSETFNIVTADYVDCGLPIVVSPAVSWAPRIFQADPTSVPSIVAAMHRAWFMRNIGGTALCRRALQRYNAASMDRWFDYLYR